MLAAPGAAWPRPQIGVGLRVFTYHVDDDEHGHLINPDAELPRRRGAGRRGGLPVDPGPVLGLPAHRHVVARGFDLHGEPVTLTGSDVLARCVQHETDHLDGILFVDRLDPETRRRALAEIREAPLGRATGGQG